MIALSFDVKGSLAHFRRADTTATHLTYPFITPTAARGLVGAILGIEDFVTDDKIAIQLRRPVITVTQQMSMLGAGTNAFNRPTTIELLVNPAYRIYYVGSEYGESLLEALEADRMVYPTFLGSAFALTKPVLHKRYERVERVDTVLPLLQTTSVVPTSIVNYIQFEGEREYSRADGFMLHYKGQRTFEKSIDFIYERNGKTIAFEPLPNFKEADVELMRLEDEIVCVF